MSLDFVRFLTKWLCNRVKQKTIFAQNFRKIAGWIKVIVKVGERILLKLWE